MLIFWEQRMVFLATPKAGSTAVEVALESLASVSLQRPTLLKHTDIATYRRHIGPWLLSQTGACFETIALMREPVDWLRSWYRFKQRDDHDDPAHQLAGVSFPDFARQYATADSPMRQEIGSQADFLTSDDGPVDRIFRYEAIDDFIHHLEDRVGCAIELPRINVPPSIDVELDPQQEAMLRNAMARDLQLYATL